MWPTFKEIKVLNSVKKFYFEQILKKVVQNLLKIYFSKNLGDGMILKTTRKS
jgi:hypothetical protein